MANQRRVRSNCTIYGGKVVSDIEHELIATQWDLKVAKDRIKRMEEAGDALMEIVEGARSERWNVNGFRLKDTPEWVQFYVSFRKAKRSKWKEAKP